MERKDRRTSRELKPEPLMVKLFEEHGETSRFVYAEIDEEGDLIFSGQDVGKAPLEVWGDIDYEFRVRVTSDYKDKVLRALIERSQRPEMPEPADPLDRDRALIALVEELYGSHFSAVDEFRDYMELKGIPCGFSNYG